MALNGESYASKEGAIKAGVAVLSYGNFLQALIDFLCIAFVLFLIVKQANKFKKPVPPAAVA
ncbi:MAG: MscL family protein [Bdellovibrionaceae bacterium]|nr:MscL family protein [Pseudobdellovibrionaceae bacterium]